MKERDIVFAAFGLSVALSELLIAIEDLLAKRQGSESKRDACDKHDEEDCMECFYTTSPKIPEPQDRSKRHKPDKKRLDYGIFANNKEILDNKKRKELKQK